jgi:hypothetical protein
MILLQKILKVPRKIKQIYNGISALSLAASNIKILLIFVPRKIGFDFGKMLAFILLLKMYLIN